MQYGRVLQNHLFKRNDHCIFCNHNIAGKELPHPVVRVSCHQKDGFGTIRDGANC